MKQFNVPGQYKNSIVKRIKQRRNETDKLKKDLTPSCIDFKNIEFYLPRNFGFCYGVENAISICNNIIANNHEQKKIYVLSELIHNPIVNRDLLEQGVQFLMHTDGTSIIPFSQLSKNDIVIIPAFGTTVEIENKLIDIGIDIKKYYSTCPFVEKVWKKGKQLLDQNYTIVIHGKPEHEETRATFSHVTQEKNPCLIILNLQEAQLLMPFIQQQKTQQEFEKIFAGRFTPGFDIKKDLQKLGVINQTTMLAYETQAISDFLKNVLATHFQLNENNLTNHFADTRDTLCYATNENQKAVEFMVTTQRLDLVMVVGGKNSSNTCNLFKIADKHVPTFFISHEKDLVHSTLLNHYNVYEKTETFVSHDFFNIPNPKIGIVIGASCPDYQIDLLIKKIMSFIEDEAITEKKFEEII